MLVLRKGRLKGCATGTPLSRAKAKAGSSMAVLANRYGSRPAAEDGQAGSNAGGGRAAPTTGSHTVADVPAAGM